LFSRTQDLAAAFADALSLADEVILLPIYPARELPIPGVTSSTIAAFMEHEKAKLLTKEEMLQFIATTKPSLLVMAGAGDIDTLLKPVQNLLNA
jgi:UDP-N-acetylmuramate--alanine ligase